MLIRERYAGKCLPSDDGKSINNVNGASSLLYRKTGNMLQAKELGVFKKVIQLTQGPVVQDSSNKEDTTAETASASTVRDSHHDGDVSLDRRVPKDSSGNAEYEQASFAKAFNPAFADDYANKKVRFSVRFAYIKPAVMDLPAEYREGYVRMLVVSIDDRHAVSDNFLVPKEASGPIFDLRREDEIEVFGTLKPIIRISPLSGRSGKSVLMVADKVTSLKAETIPDGAFVKEGDTRSYFVLRDDGTFQERQPNGESEGTYRIDGNKITWIFKGGGEGTDAYFGDYIEGKYSHDIYRKKVNQNQEVAEKPVVSASCPAVDTNVPFGKLINPAFAKDYAGCSIRTRAKFGASGADAKDTIITAKATKENKVVFRLLAPGAKSAEGGVVHALIGKAQSDVVFDLSEGDTIDLVGRTRFISGTNMAPVFEAKSVQPVKN